MDAKCKERQRDRAISQRENRWSMNSQRLEEIVAELMKPISDVRRSFDTDLGALLEEYLTEAGLYALEACEQSPVPNFAELALLLQHSASVYGRKVDFLYQQVLNVSDSLHNSTQEIAQTQGDEPSTPAANRRKRKASSSVPGNFSPLELEPCPAAQREPGAVRPPPTLPRMYIELEPRVLTDGDVPLLDYADEPIGLLSDFHVTWRLQNGLLVDELESATATDGGSLRPISLMELQAAIEAASPGPAPPGSPPPGSPPLGSPLQSIPALTPLSPASPPPRASTPLPSEEMPLSVKKKRKRRSEVKIDDIIGGSVKMLIDDEARRRLRLGCEFSVAAEWVAAVVERRKQRVLAVRRGLERDPPDFHGFEQADDIGGFPGWSRSEASKSARVSERVTGRVGEGVTEPDSDDDGFFERSSLGDSDASRVDDSPLAPAHTHQGGQTEIAAWQARVLRRAAAAETLDVHALAARTLAACAAPPDDTSESFTRLLARVARHPADVSRLLLATLFLANAGNVEIVPGPPLSLNSFSVRVLSTDERLYCAAADEPFMR